MAGIATGAGFIFSLSNSRIPHFKTLKRIYYELHTDKSPLNTVLHARACSYLHIISLLFFSPPLSPQLCKKKKKEWINRCLPLFVALFLEPGNDGATRNGCNTSAHTHGRAKKGCSDESASYSRPSPSQTDPL
jgi:hypothetical protein